MTVRVIGVENEYAVCALDADDAWSAAAGSDEIMTSARRTLTYLPGSGRVDLFLQNGSRLYEDAGYHIELCTPETANPDDCVRYFMAGRAMLRDLARARQGGESDDSDDCLSASVLHGTSSW